jgi:CheY-like chemotaxis protein
MSKTILLVEDYDDSREMLKFHLEDAGYLVVEAANGYEAVEIVKQEPPDLILMDMSMPEMDGVAATRRIKKLAETDEIPIICVTSHDHFYSEKAIEAGCEEVITKPVDLKNLDKVIERNLRKE